jgi:hypothetical protein
MGNGGPFPGVKRSRGVTLTTHPHLVPGSKMRKSYRYLLSPQAPSWSVVGHLRLASTVSVCKPRLQSPYIGPVIGFLKLILHPIVIMLFAAVTLFLPPDFGHTHLIHITFCSICRHRSQCAGLMTFLVAISQVLLTVI